ncbi:MAG: methionine adenosyltransferase domain-containing protein [Bacteroidales bacterium]|nr:methionine adenosyltransferase domain-containing protein [Bacteroidales bacterium]
MLFVNIFYSLLFHIFSSKTYSKSYAARYIAKNLIAAGIAEECLVQLAYAIGVAEPVSVYVDTYGTRHIEVSDAEIAQKVRELFDLRPAAIIKKFGLKNPIYEPTAAYGHMGRKPYVKDGIQFFGWELLDSVDRIKEAFSL